MTPQEMHISALHDQVLSAFAKHAGALYRIAEGGRDDTDYDESLCRMMAHAILGELHESAHYAKVEGDDG